MVDYSGGISQGSIGYNPQQFVSLDQATLLNNTAGNLSGGRFYSLSCISGACVNGFQSLFPSVSSGAYGMIGPQRVVRVEC